MKPLLITLLVFLTSISFAQTTQETIDKAMGECFATESITPLTENYETVKDQTYWAAYNLYLQTAYLMKMGADYAEPLEKGMNLLIEKKDKNSEEYTLLASLASMKMGLLSNVGELMTAQNNFYAYIDAAFDLDKNNPRAYYVAGLYDFYKPVQFGGGTLAKDYMNKAVELFENQTGDITWGADEAKQLLEQLNK